MKLLRMIGIAGLTLSFGSLLAFGQETEAKVVDEVVAQVNDGVITLSGIKREMKLVIETKVGEGMKREDAQKLVDEKRGELIANLINEELVIQKAKELGLEREIEEAINTRFIEIMKQNNLKTMAEMEAEMRRQNVDPDDIRLTWRKQITRELVIQRAVQSKLYWEGNGKELKEYYEKNKAKFTKPATISLSELFLSFAGRDPAAVRAKAKQLVTQARGGGDFAKIVVENSDRQGAAASKGKVDPMPVKDLEKTFAAAVEGLKPGGISEPVEVDDTGIVILRVDDRTEASNESQFDEGAVRLERMKERFPERQKKFMAELRDESYIKINDTYRPLVSPILFSEERKAKPAN